MAKTIKRPSHPKYIDMIKAAIADLKERNGSSGPAIKKYIGQQYPVDLSNNIVKAHMRKALQNGVKSGALKLTKGTGAAGSYKLGELPKPAEKPKRLPKTKKPTKAKKPVAKKPKSPKKKKPSAKTAVKAKKPASKKTPKKAAKSPAKKKVAKKPAAKKTVKKKVVKK